MKVKMTRTISGTIDGADYPPVGGDLVVDDAQGAWLCEQGYAEPVVDRAAPETATAKKPQTRKG